jgi:hypothetical protein
VIECAVCHAVPFVTCPSLSCWSRGSRGRHALFPPKGEEEKKKGALELHRPA